MANYPQELEDLIQEYLTDGIITEKERRVLLNKARDLGLNVDEVDLYIDAQEQKIEQANRAAAAKVKGRTCPYCGSAIPQLTDKCSCCGQSVTVQADKELEDIVNHLEDALVEFKSGNDFDKNKANVERHIRKAEMYYGNNPKIKILLDQVREESMLASKKAKSKQRMYFIGKILTYNKWLTAGVIIVIIGGIGSILSALKGPDVTEDAETCIKAMHEAIEAKDFIKAEGLYKNYHKGKSKLDPATLELALAYVEDDKVEKAIQLTDECYKIKDPVAKALLKKKYYNEAWILYKGYEEACSIVDAMRETGDNAQIKPFVEKTIDYFGDYEGSNYWKLRNYAGLK